MNRGARRAAARVMATAAKVASDRYRRALVGILRGVHAEYMDVLEPNIPNVALGHKSDAAYSRWTRQLDKLDNSIKDVVAAKTRQAFDEMQQKVNEANYKAAKRLLGITPTKWVGDHIEKARDANIKLVENAARVYAQDVRDIFDDPDNFGLAPDELKGMLLDRGRVSESRAELIARDQTLKLNGSLNQTRQMAAGVDEYIWSTSDDERVRETHAELDGKTFSWSSPPEPGHPGDDYQCRCVAIPVIPELD